MTRVRVKICGLTRTVDALDAVAAGADAVGLVFHAASPRSVTIRSARQIACALPPFVARVALFMDPEADDVRRVIEAVPIDVLQFHGRESPAFCEAFGRPYLKAVPMGDDDIDLHAWAHRHATAQGLLLDANRSGMAGGRGESFDWQRSIRLPDRPIIVAGGLAAGNVGAAIARFAPYAVDVSSGVERAPGIKDHERMREFMSAVERGVASTDTGRPAHA